MRIYQLTSSHISIVNTLWIFSLIFTRNKTEILLSVLAKNALYYQNKQCFEKKSNINFDSIGVTLMGLSSLHVAYGPGDYCYILVVIETTQTCLDLGGRDT